MGVAVRNFASHSFSPLRSQVQNHFPAHDNAVNKVVSLPPGAWDSHIHVFDEDRWPISPDHPYRPRKADPSDLMRVERGLGITNVCLIAFSVYGYDNTSILDALEELKGHARAVVAFDPKAVEADTLRAMHESGVRGVRVNLKTTSTRMNADTLREVLHSYADCIRPLGWRIQLYVSLDQIKLIAPIVPELGVICIFDHLGSPSNTTAPRLQPGYKEFMELLKTGQAYTKLSGTYRFPDMPETEEYVREILNIAPDRVVWATDWPHSGGVQANPGGDRNQIQDYRKIDNQAWVAKCQLLCNFDVGLIKKIWVENPNRLWDFDS